MRIISKITIGLAAATLLIVGCSPKTVSEESLGLRKTALYAESNATHGDETKYGTGAAGSGYKIQRAFQDAPPMIPHDIEGMTPITIDNNQCVSCHMPEVAVSVGATSVPPSHLTTFRPAVALTKDGKLMNNGEVVDPAASSKANAISIKSNGDKLSGTRFNCTQCHAPQSEGLAVENNFKPVYTSKDGANKSSWNGAKMTEGLNTVEGK
ncbi:MAG: nitrate reductase cytochrome c-type subunit [Sulfurimonas sp.]|jgi:cytochrome c-type protein NapB